MAVAEVPAVNQDEEPVKTGTSNCRGLQLHARCCNMQILLRAEQQARLKHLLDSFSDATDLCVNYNKSTGVPNPCLPQCVSILGLPLSNGKLKLSAFDQQVGQRYFSGWRAWLLHMGAVEVELPPGGHGRDSPCVHVG
jgi:hypothetical protein